MAEFLSFILFVAVIAGSLYLLFVLILPGLAVYLGGVTMSLLAATYLVRQDKHRARFASVPVSGRTVRHVSLAVIIMPLVHATFMWLFKDIIWLIWILSINMTLSLLWLVVFLMHYRRDLKVYKRENGELKAVRASIIARKEALNIKADSLRCLLDRPQGLESWEIAVMGNDMAEQDVDRKKIETLITQISTMVTEFDDIVTKHDELALKCKDNDLESCKACEDLKVVIKETESTYKERINLSDDIINQYEI